MKRDDAQNQQDQDVYRYEIVINPIDERYTNEVGLNVYKKNTITGKVESYSGIYGDNLYDYINQHYGLSEEKGETKFIQFSMTPEYIEGLSANNKFVSGKLIDPKTKQQIGHWIYDLDKDDFKEVIINQ